MKWQPFFNFYRPKRSFGQGNVFTGVCDSVHREGSSGTPPPKIGGTPLGPDLPPQKIGGTTPLDQTPPLG